MARKKWTAQEDISDSILKFREKRKWQLALRRYIIERNPSEAYAPYFGVGIELFRNWIELQFWDNLNWENFGTQWQFDHIIPVSYFNYSIPEDLLLCWNFINIRVEKIELNKAGGNRIDLLAVKPYFETLYNSTDFSLCFKMVEKIDQIVASNKISEPTLENFLVANKTDLEKLKTLSSSEFLRLNKGMSLDDLLLEREILRKFG